MENLEKLKTWDDLRYYLYKRSDFATSEPSKVNTSFTKRQHWNDLIKDCMKYSGKDLPIRTKSLLIKRVRKDFGMKIYLSADDPCPDCGELKNEDGDCLC